VALTFDPHATTVWSGDRAAEYARYSNPDQTSATEGVRLFGGVDCRAGH
jgi:hypothetical protein